MASRTEPIRTCAGCRARSPKSSLLRVVRAADGSVHVDVGGRAPGRGAYVHQDPACVEASVEHGGLPRALRTGVGTEIVGRLRELTRGNA